MDKNLIAKRVPLIVIIAFTIAHIVLFLATSQLNDGGTVLGFLLILLLCYALPAFLLYALSKSNIEFRHKAINLIAFCACLATYAFVTVFYLVRLTAYGNKNFSNVMLGSPAMIIYLALACIVFICALVAFTSFKKPNGALEWVIAVLTYLILAIFVAMIIHAVIEAIDALGGTGMYRELGVVLVIFGYLVAIFVLTIAWAVCKILKKRSV
ncbi:MAG: hypothetical protein E7370_04360 [Clostridiales bacterium]|nr:hypothetical protein [Clostridiales bacterium]